MPEPYSVVEVQEEWVLDPEIQWVLKTSSGIAPGEQIQIGCSSIHSEADSGEHWAEKIAAEVASLLGVPHAKVELATFRGTTEARQVSHSLKGASIVKIEN